MLRRMKSPASERVDPKAAFAALGVAGPLLQAVVELGYEEPTPIQHAAIPPLLAGRDVLGQAATGTGKTAAFALPVLQRLATAPARASAGPRGRERPLVRALVLVPTRELAVQVAEAMHRYGRALAARILAIFGGQPIHQQLAPLRQGVDVVVATPGRALDHVRRGSLALDAVEIIVLDEADEMLDMGFADDLDALLAEVPAERQAALFSATLPRRISALAERHLHDPVRIAIPVERVAASDAPRVRHVAYVVHRREKIEALARVLDFERPTSVIVFCRTRTEVDELTETLAARGYRCEPLHGGRAQDQRTRVMRRFREGQIDVLIATDVAARGLDIEHVSHVINFDVPCSTDAYVHRVGRTGRAGRSGVAITLAEPRERRLIRDVERVLAHRIRIADVPTVDDVRARRLHATGESLRAAMTAGDLGAYRPIVARLAAEFDPIDVASAALKLMHERGGVTAPPPMPPRAAAAASPCLL
jgi:ATP-dependent RNA helicase DeaD